MPPTNDDEDIAKMDPFLSEPLSEVREAEAAGVDSTVQPIAEELPVLGEESTVAVAEDGAASSPADEAEAEVSLAPEPSVPASAPHERGLVTPATPSAFSLGSVPSTPITPAPAPLAARPTSPTTTASSSDEEELPEIPALVLPTMFLPIPNTDPLSVLLAKHIPPEQRPPRDVTGEWQRSDVQSLVMSNSWRALARMARDRLVTTDPDPDNLPLIFSLWSLRLTSLARLRLTNQAAAECSNLFRILDSLPPVILERMRMGHAQILPFELDVFRARCRLWAGDHLGHLDALHALLRKCKSAARVAGRKAAGPPRGPVRPSATPATKGAGAGAGEAGAATKTKEVSEEQVMWIERAARVGLILASALVDMKEHEAAIALLEPLLKQSTPSSTSMPELKSAIARIKLQAGLVQDARQTFKEIETDEGVSSDAKDFNTAILASAEGEWEVCAEILARLAKRDERVEGEKGSSEDQREDRKAEENGVNRVAVANNLAVALLAQGRISNAVDALEVRMREEPKAVASVEGALFNLATLYELQSVSTAERKRGLLVQAARWSGDGLRTTCLKMPAS